MSWTDERVETLKKMWGEGQSASQIAKELGGVTRNAVIGKVHRLGLSNRAGTGAKPVAEKPAAKPVAKPAPAKPKPAAAAPEAPAPEPEPAPAPKPETIFATNTSSLPIHKIAEKAQRPENVVGLHYFSPAEKMPLVEVIPHETTSEETISTVVALAKKQGKTPIVVKDTAGFYVNRILAPYMNEAAHLLLANEPIEKLDSTLLDFGFPVGPITLLDEVGVDIGAKIIPILVNELGDRFQGPDVFDILLNDNRKGRKSGKGFYTYKGRKKEVDKSVYKLLKLQPEPKLSDNDIAMRCVLPMLNEAVRCLDDGIIRSPRDGDIGAIFGIGFPPFLGGPFRYMDQIGIKSLVEMMNDFAKKYGDRFAPCDGLLTRAGLDESFYK